MEKLDFIDGQRGPFVLREYAGLLQKGTQQNYLYANINRTQLGEATYQVLLI